MLTLRHWYAAVWFKKIQLFEHQVVLQIRKKILAIIAGIPIHKKLKIKSSLPTRGFFSKCIMSGTS